MPLMHRSNLPKRRDAEGKPWNAWSFFSAFSANGDGKLCGFTSSDLPSGDCFWIAGEGRGRSGGAEGRLFRAKASAWSPSTATQKEGRRPIREDRSNGRHKFPTECAEHWRRLRFPLYCLALCQPRTKVRSSICLKPHGAPGKAVGLRPSGRLLWRIP
jgi:hypothetical protein